MSRSSSSRNDVSSAATRKRGKIEAWKHGNTDSALRQTGFPIVGDIPWGAHICMFYETKEDLLDTAASYFSAGLRNNEFCMWAVSDPVTLTEATNALHLAIPGFGQHLLAGRIEILQGTEWYLDGDQFGMQKIMRGWSDRLNDALAKGYVGMRVTGNAFWIETDFWREFYDYEQELNRSLAGQKIILLCAYELQASAALDVLDVARAHQCTLARRKGEWEFLETPELRQAKQEIKKLNNALNVLSKPFPGSESLTVRERAALAQIVRGASSKEAARSLGISPRTMEFHRANVMRKLGAKNAADLVRIVLGE